MIQNHLLYKNSLLMTDTLNSLQGIKVSEFISLSNILLSKEINIRGFKST